MIERNLIKKDNQNRENGGRRNNLYIIIIEDEITDNISYNDESLKLFSITARRRPMNCNKLIGGFAIMAKIELYYIETEGLLFKESFKNYILSKHRT